MILSPCCKIVEILFQQWPLTCRTSCHEEVLCHLSKINRFWRVQIKYAVRNCTSKSQFTPYCLLAFLIISTMEVYSYDMFLECNLHFVMGNRIFCWSTVQFLVMCRWKTNYFFMALIQKLLTSLVSFSILFWCWLVVLLIAIVHYSKYPSCDKYLAVWVSLRYLPCWLF